MLSVVNDDGTTANGSTDGSSPIDEIVREGAGFERGHLVDRPEAVAA